MACFSQDFTWISCPRFHLDSTWIIGGAQLAVYIVSDYCKLNNVCNVNGSSCVVLDQPPTINCFIVHAKDVVLNMIEIFGCQVHFYFFPRDKVITLVNYHWW